MMSQRLSATRGNTHTAMRLQVSADAAQVHLQLVHVMILVVIVMQDVVQVEVQDVGVEAADVLAFLEEVRGQARPGRRRATF